MNICIRYSWKRLRDISCSCCMLILLYVVFVVSCFCCFVSGRGKHNRLLRSNVDILIFRWVMWSTAFLIFFKKWHRLFSSLIALSKIVINLSLKLVNLFLNLSTFLSSFLSMSNKVTWWHKHVINFSNLWRQVTKTKKLKTRKRTFFCKITKDNVQWLPILYAYDKQFDLIIIKENRCWQIKNEMEFKAFFLQTW